MDITKEAFLYLFLPLNVVALEFIYKNAYVSKF